MSRPTILFLKSMPEVLLSTEDFALKVRDDPKYDDNELINKKAIDTAFELYEDRLNPTYRFPLLAKTKFDVYLEGHFIAQNIPEISSIVSHKICTIDVLRDYLENHPEITHIGLTAYAMGMDKTIETIKTINKDYSHVELFVGGIGAFYPHVQELVPKQNLCFGEGVNWLRKKFGLKLLSRNEYIIPRITGNMTQFPVPLKSSYLITQIGCPNTCDFCYSSHCPGYNPFSNPRMIIEHIEEAYHNSNDDIILHICDPNAFYPERVWKEVFNYFIENQNKFDRNIFVWSLASLNHLSNFNLEKIQNSPLKFFFVNYGIESTIKSYKKNRGNPKEVINTLNKLNVLTYHTFIIGFPIHTPELLRKEVASNLQYDSDRFFVNAFKPIPNTLLYNQLKDEGRLLGRNLPPEFLCTYEYMAFKHPHLGYGFDILPFIFETYYETEKKEIDFWGKTTDKLLNIFEHTSSRIIKKAASTFINFSKLNFKTFKYRMSDDLVEIYANKIKKNEEKLKSFS
ncbi:MAG: hypothetical protein ACFFAS_12945 [Promethearchaeota archaeon]